MDAGRHRLQPDPDRQGLGEQIANQPDRIVSRRDNVILANANNELRHRHRMGRLNSRCHEVSTVPTVSVS